jgi:hypothetical protein
MTQKRLSCPLGYPLLNLGAIAYSSGLIGTVALWVTAIRGDVWIIAFSTLLTLLLLAPVVQTHLVVSVLYALYKDRDASSKLLWIAWQLPLVAATIAFGVAMLFFGGVSPPLRGSLIIYTASFAAAHAVAWFTSKIYDALRKP